MDNAIIDNTDQHTKQLQLRKLKLEVESLQKGNKVPALWNSLEIAKFIATLALPLVLVYVTSQASDQLREIENNQKAITQQNSVAIENNKRIYDLRASIYQQISLRVNEIYCYLYYVGRWKELTPERLLENKRFCDEQMYANQPLFSPEFFGTYRNFMAIAYKTYSGEGEDAKLRTDLYAHRKYYTGQVSWNSQWDGMFCEGGDAEDIGNRQSINAAYNSFFTWLSKELNIKEQTIQNQFKDFKPK